MNHKKAFTLLEITVSVIIIGIIFSIVMVSYAEVQKNKRDQQRISNTEQLKMALSLYNLDTDRYPDNISFGQALIHPDTSKVYLAQIPVFNEFGCPDNSFLYISDPLTNNYYLQICLEKAQGVYYKGINCINVNNDSLTFGACQ